CSGRRAEPAEHFPPVHSRESGNPGAAVRSPGSPLSRGRTERVPSSTGGGLFDRSLVEGPLDAAVAQRQSNRFVSDRLTVRIRPAAPVDFLRRVPPDVIAGLDPAIHPLRKRVLRRIAKVLTKTMDPRVKPAGDGVSTASASYDCG